jgi:hypothetical protein
MDENKNIENKIKTIFTERNISAPADLWNKLSDKLPESDPERHLETKVKNSFENMDKSAPPRAWGAVNKQLNIDRVWERINRELDKRVFIYWRNIASLLLLVLLGISCGIYHYYQTPSLLAYGNETTGKKHQNSKQPGFSNDPNLNSGGTTQNTNNEITGNPTLKTAAPQVEENPGSNEKNLTAGDVTHRKSVPVSKGQYDQKSKSRNNSNYTLYKKKIVSEKDTTSDPDRNTSLADKIGLTYMNMISTGSILTQDKAMELSLHMVNRPDSLTDCTRVIFTPGIKVKRWEMGVCYSYNNTWILDNETQKSFDQNSLVSTSPVFAGSYGLLANYRITKLGAISAEFYINSKSHQEYGEFIEGKYYKHTLEFNYAKLILLYQLNINQRTFIKIPSRFTFKGGFYCSYLKNYKNSYNNPISMDTYKYTPYDYGIKLAIGQEKMFRNSIIGFGFNAEYGFNNNFAGNTFIPAYFNVTKNALLGVYLNLKYGL